MLESAAPLQTSHNNNNIRWHDEELWTHLHVDPVRKADPAECRQCAQVIGATMARLCCSAFSLLLLITGASAVSMPKGACPSLSCSSNRFPDGLLISFKSCTQTASSRQPCAQGSIRSEPRGHVQPNMDSSLFHVNAWFRTMRTMHHSLLSCGRYLLSTGCTVPQHHARRPNNRTLAGFRSCQSRRLHGALSRSAGLQQRCVLGPTIREPEAPVLPLL